MLLRWSPMIDELAVARLCNRCLGTCMQSWAVARFVQADIAQRTSCFGHVALLLLPLVAAQKHRWRHEATVAAAAAGVLALCARHAVRLATGLLLRLNMQ